MFNSSVRSAITVSLVEEARGGPFVFWNGVEVAAQQAAALGFDALEIFAPSAQEVDRQQLRQLCDQHHLQIAAFGTGAGMVKHGLSLSSADAEERARARQFVAEIIELGGTFHAPAIIGSMQGRWTATVPRDQALQWLGEQLNALGELAAERQVPLLFEPLNRYESNLFNTLEDTANFVQSLTSSNVRILADLFHMNIEEADSAQALRKCGELVGHIHFADSNRRAVGFGQSNMPAVAAAIRDIGYTGYLSAEVFPLPNAAEAARQTINSFRKFFGQESAAPGSDSPHASI